MKSIKHTRIALILSVLLIFLAAVAALALGTGRREGENETTINENAVIQLSPDEIANDFEPIALGSNADINTIEPWMEAYTELLLDNTRMRELNINAPDFKLIDVDFNGIPELFVIRAFNRLPMTAGLYTYSDGALVELTLPDNGLPWPYNGLPWEIGLYRDTHTNELMWISSYERENWTSAGYENTFLWHVINFDDLSSITSQLHFGFGNFWDSPNHGDENLMSNLYFWTFENGHNDYNNRTAVDSGEDILQMLEDSFSNLLKLSPVLHRPSIFQHSSFELNEDNLMEYISSWERPPASPSPFDFYYLRQRLDTLASYPPYNRHEPLPPLPLGLTVGFGHDIDPALYEDRLPIRYYSPRSESMGSETIIIFTDEEFISDFRAFSVNDIDFIDDVFIYTPEEIFYLPRLSNEYYIEYTTRLAETIPSEGIRFIVNDITGETASFFLSPSGMDGTLIAYGTLNVYEREFTIDSTYRR
jgi:hypothetical protein